MNAIATPGDPAIAPTGIGLIIVAIIAGFESLIEGIQVEPLNTIATPGRFAAVRARVGRIQVAIITKLFAGSEHAIAATRFTTIAQATVRLHVVAIITSLIVFRIWLEIQTTDAIATPGRLTSCCAGVIILLITVVTGFHALPDEAVAAASF